MEGETYSGEKRANERADLCYRDGDRGDAFQRTVANYKIHPHVDMQPQAFKHGAEGAVSPLLCPDITASLDMKVTKNQMQIFQSKHLITEYIQ